MEYAEKGQLLEWNIEKEKVMKLLMSQILKKNYSFIIWMIK